MLPSGKNITIAGGEMVSGSVAMALDFSSTFVTYRVQVVKFSEITEKEREKIHHYLITFL